MIVLQKAFLAYTQGNYQNVANILEPLIEKEDVMALLILGTMYRTGKKGLQDFPKNSKVAFVLLHKAAEQGNADAQFNVGMMYCKGERSEPNLDEARRYLELAADQGHAEAIDQLANLFKTAPKLN